MKMLKKLTETEFDIVQVYFTLYSTSVFFLFASVLSLTFSTFPFINRIFFSFLFLGFGIYALILTKSTKKFISNLTLEQEQILLNPHKDGE